ncbi:hypothetical protein [Gemella cuniculi]|uniref:hypothetical protein n=1 Tax=Gemella cuniculi TaxID=150240 RepID=UPI0004105D7C|nr:hypothetical protein [Gemella cuniculi]
MSKIEEIKNKISLLSDGQLDIILDIINSWNINLKKVQTDEEIVKDIYETKIATIKDPLKNYSSEKLLEEYGILFYNPCEKNNFDGTKNLDINHNFFTETQNVNSISQNLYSSSQKNSEINFESNYSGENLEKNLNDFDPLFPDSDFDSLSNLSNSKYDDLDFSTLISKKPQ